MSWSRAVLGMGLVFLCALCAEAGAWAVFILGGEGLWLALAAGLHGLAAASLFWLPGRLCPDWVAENRHAPALYGWLTLFLPGMGLAGSLGAALARAGWMNRIGLVDQFRDMMEGENVRPDSLAADRSERDLVMEETATQPLVDILASSDPELKRGAIGLLVRLGTAKAVGLLKEALNDPLPEVRLYAHTALTEMDNAAMERIKAGTEKAASGQAGDLAELGRLCRDYALGGLPDTAGRAHFLEQAQEAYAQVLALTPEDPAASLALGRILLALGRRKEARPLVETALRIKSLQVPVYLTLCRLHYEARDFAALRRTGERMAAISDYGDASPGDIIMFEFWSRKREAAHG